MPVHGACVPGAEAFDLVPDRPAAAFPPVLRAEDPGQPYDRRTVGAGGADHLPQPALFEGMMGLKIFLTLMLLMPTVSFARVPIARLSAENQPVNFEFDWPQKGVEFDLKMFEAPET